MADEHQDTEEARSPNPFEMVQDKPRGLLPPYDEIDIKRTVSDIQDSVNDIRAALAELAQTIHGKSDRSFQEAKELGDTLRSPRENLDDTKMASMRLLDRWRYMARLDLMSFIISVAAALSAFYIIFANAAKAMRFLVSVILPAAHSAGQNSQPVISDTNENYALLILACIVLWAMYTISCSTKPTAVTFAKDILKVVVGFFGGFFGRGR